MVLHGAGGPECAICNSPTHSSVVCPFNWDTAEHPEQDGVEDE